MIYKVTKKFSRGSENEVGRFKTQNEAVSFIQTKLAEDVDLKIEAVYFIYEGFDLLESYDQSQLKSSPSSKSEDSGASQKGSGQRFSPSPFQTAPRPSGMPPSSWKNEETDKKK